MSESQTLRNNTWSTQLTFHALARPEDAAIRFGGETLTWRELDRRVTQLASWLVSRGVSKGSRVALVMGNRPEFLETMYACARVGAIAVPINFRLTAPEIDYILTNSGASVVITESLFSDAVFAAEAAQGVDVVSVGSACDEQFSQIMEEAWPEVEFDDVSGDDPAAIMYTSGTTGKPKGAVLTHNNFAATADVVIDAWRLSTPGHVVLAATPLFHIGGFGTTTGPLRLGTPLVIHPSVAFDPVEVLALIEAERVTATFMVPAQWQAICTQPSASTSGAGLRVAGWGAAPAPMWLLERLGEVFESASVVALFGQTEMSPITCVLRGSDALRKKGSVGRPVFNVAVRVVDADMNDVDHGEIGEIVYRGLGLMAEYWENPEATAQAMAGGWFHSGDLVRRDSEGFVFVVDRKKDMIISGGENIYSAEVEMALSSHPGVRDVAVIGRPDEKLGEAVVAVVEPVDISSPPDLETLVAHCRTQLASYKKPRDLVIVEALPRNSTGKVTKQALRAE
ncbi:long-chain-fatty-acid--CoA ligase [Gordonia jacobaea]|uniref:long-chain-fatty-acid--CoA ligase n=1 Tax=Gordonia jacobaea TaxID=122202 RepID=UPI003D709378